MRLPAFILGLATLLAVPTLLVAQDGASKAPVTKGAKATAKTAKTSSKAVKRVLAKVKPKSPVAKDLFGAVKTPAPLAPRSIGFYAKGCLAGAEAMPIDGPAWQAMRLSRNRNWGHPVLIALVKKLAMEAKEHDGWPGLLVGDFSQPRGGPMTSGHASHQIGLDADLWLTPMPDRTLTRKEREELSATSMLAEDRVSVNPKVFTPAHVKLLKRAASYEEVQRVLVHPAIKKAVCDASKEEKERSWLSKIRPYWGHYYHFHIRIACPKGSTGCQGQPEVDDDNDGCGAELAQWLKRVKPGRPVVVTPPTKPAPPPPVKRPTTLAELPEACRAVLASGDTPPSVKEALAPPKAPAPASKVAPEPKAAPAPKVAPAPKAAPAPKEAKTAK